MIIKSTDREGLRRADRMVKSYQCEQCRAATLVLKYQHPDYKLMCGKCGSETFYKPRSATAMWLDDPDSVPIATQMCIENKLFPQIDAMVEGLPEPAKQAVLKKYHIENKIRKEKHD